MHEQEEDPSVPADGPPGLAIVSLPVFMELQKWFPHAEETNLQELALTITRDICRAVHIEGEIWQATLWYDPEGLQPDHAHLVDQVYLAVRHWYRHHPATVSLEVATSIVDDVLDMQQVAGELWSLHVPSSGNDGLAYDDDEIDSTPSGFAGSLQLDLDDTDDDWDD